MAACHEGRIRIGPSASSSPAFDAMGSGASFAGLVETHSLTKRARAKIEYSDPVCGGLTALAPFGTFSHHTALTLLSLTDFIPSRIHLST
jgi:hypothetical protein